MSTVVLVGRPNVGKSTLFNRILGQRQAVTAAEAGTTRDLLFGSAHVAGRSFTVVDLAGVEDAPTGRVRAQERTPESGLATAVQSKVQEALHMADLIVWVQDSNDPNLGNDRNFAEKLRQTGKPIVLAANKCDHPSHRLRLTELTRYGFSPIVPVSALHGSGIDALLAAIVAELPEEGRDEASQSDAELTLAIVGRPNVGKSTLLNALLGSERAVVSSIAGTTRDSVDSLVEPARLFGSTRVPWDQVRLVDTAGIRRRGKVGHAIEAWSMVRSLDAIDRAAVVLAVTDGTEGTTNQDLQVLQRIVDAGRGLVITVNKWDVVLDAAGVVAGTTEDQDLQDDFTRRFQSDHPFLTWAPLIFISAEQGMNLEAIGRAVVRVHTAWSRMYDREALAAVRAKVITIPKLERVLRVTQEHAQPPVFHIHLEGRQLLHFSGSRAVENQIRSILKIGPTPLKLWFVTGRRAKQE